jgi:hypothetical protein
MKAILLVILMLFASAPVMAAQGDCGQPVSNGSQPIASDCLFILRAAVGSETCSPACACNTNGVEGATASDALICLKKAVGQAVELACRCGFGPVRVGGETQLNTYTTSSQIRPSVAADAEGNFIVAWESDGSSGSDSDVNSVQAQRFLSTGEQVGSQFEVNTFTTSHQSFVSLAAGDDGAFVMAWSNYGTSPSDTTNSVRARLFDNSGAAVGDDFQVNSYTTGNQKVPSVGMDGAGNFAVVWQSVGSSGSDASSFSIQGQRYDSSGAAVGTEFQINTYTTDAQTAPAIAVASSGQFVVVWTSSSSSVPNASIRGQRFDQDGAALGTEFTANTRTFGPQSVPEVAIHANGGFVVAWNAVRNSSFYNFKSTIQGRRFDSDGTPVGGEFDVNSYSTRVKTEQPSVAFLADGAFVVVWHGLGYGYAPYGHGPDAVRGQAFNADGRAFGSEFRVNIDHESSFADVAPGANNGFAVVWHSYGSAGSDSAGHSIQGQRFE